MNAFQMMMATASALQVNNSSGDGVGFNSQRQGDIDLGWLRPYHKGNGERSYVTINEGSSKKEYEVSNSGIVATLPYDAWKEIDTVVIKASQPQLKFVSALQAAGLSRSTKNGIGTLVVQSEAESDITEAAISMDGRVRSEKDRKQRDIRLTPIPVIRKGAEFNFRELLVADGSGIDNISLCAEKVAQKCESLVLGMEDRIDYGGGTVFGACNAPFRLTGTVSNPLTDPNWSPEKHFYEIAEMKKALRRKHISGDFALFYGEDWDIYLDRDYYATGTVTAGTKSLYQRLLESRNIQKIETLEFLNKTDILLISLKAETIRIHNAQAPVTVQWQVEGGLAQNFAVIAAMAPEVRKNYYGECGIFHAAVAP